MSTTEQTNERATDRAAAPEKSLKRYWVGWSSRHESIETPYVKWKTRATRVGRAVAGSTHRYSYAAVVDASDREKAWHAVASLYSDAEELFVREKASDFWPPRDRFPSPSMEFRRQADALNDSGV